MSFIELYIFCNYFSAVTGQVKIGSYHQHTSYGIAAVNAVVPKVIHVRCQSEGSEANRIWELRFAGFSSVQYSFAMHSQLTQEERCKIAAMQQFFNPLLQFRTCVRSFMTFTLLQYTLSIASFSKQVLVKPRTTSSDENTKHLWQVLAKIRGKSTGKAELELRINKRMIQRKVSKHYPYRIQFVQTLQAEGYNARVEVC